MQIIKSQRPHSSVMPYANFDAKKDAIIICANWQPSKSGRWLCELRIEDDKAIKSREIVSEKNTSVGDFIDATFKIIEDVNSELGERENAQFKLYLLKESGNKRKKKRKK